VVVQFLVRLLLLAAAAVLAVVLLVLMVVLAVVALVILFLLAVLETRHQHHHHKEIMVGLALLQTLRVAVAAERLPLDQMQPRGVMVGMAVLVLHQAFLVLL
jgi:hypothetical protein